MNICLLARRNITPGRTPVLQHRLFLGIHSARSELIYLTAFSQQYDDLFSIFDVLTCQRLSLHLEKACPKESTLVVNGRSVGLWFISFCFTELKLLLKVHRRHSLGTILQGHLLAPLRFLRQILA